MHTLRAFKFVTLVGAVLTLASCTVPKTPAPPLQGPSELGLSLALSANPDTLSFDGSSQSQITVDARDANGQPAANVVMRAAIMANNTFVDFGALSARSLVTGSNGRATLTYTAPMPVPGPIPSVSIVFTPTGSDAANTVSRAVSLRLVQPGTISAGGPTPAFTVTPATPTAFSDTLFDASTSTAAVGSAIVSYSWNFGDGSTALGVTATHRFAAGSWLVTLTVTDNTGAASSTSKQVLVGAGAAPTADFSFSPSAPATNSSVSFNGGLSKAGSGHTLVRYDWVFGSGTPQSGITVSKTYDTAGTYNVTLTVTDDVGQTAVATKSVTVSSAALTADFSMSPTNPVAGAPVQFNAGGTTVAPGVTITNYSWDFGDPSSGSTLSPVNATPIAQHTYAGSATYTIRLTVTDSLGRTATVTHTLQVN